MHQPAPAVPHITACPASADTRPELRRQLVGASLAIRRVHKLIARVADTNATVLLLGESGTGKEVAARCIHEHSARRKRPFVAVNCSAIASNLLESELFGHVKGAFTDAASARPGRFEAARGGTLFLDEIGDMSPEMQVKLLRVLEERVYERVGSSQAVVADVRIVAATHVDLGKAIETGRFREDLFYRLDVFPIEIPPLRDRLEDLPVLAKHLIERLSRGQPTFQISPAALSALHQHHWRGNVRELANLVERLGILCAGREVALEDLPAQYRPDDGLGPGNAEARTHTPSLPSLASLSVDGEVDLSGYLHGLEKNFITLALLDSQGVVAQAAKRLRLARSTMIQKMRTLGIRYEELATEPDRD